MALKLNELIVTNAINASITGNAATATSASFATTATTAANGGVTSVSAGTGIGTSASTGAVTITNSSPNATHTGDVTGATALTIANDAVTTVKILNSNVTNAKLANSSLTIGSTAISLGGTVTTFAGLASVTSTTFVGALTGNATTATALTSMNISQFTNNSGYLTSAVTSLAGTTNRITVSGATGAVTLNLPQDIHTSASPTFSGLSLTSVSTTGATITNLTGAYQNTTVYDSPRTQSATPSRGIRAPASSIQFTDSYAIAPFYTYRSTGDWPVPYGIGWGTGGESSGIFQRYASNGSSFGDMIFYTGNDGSGAFSFRRHTWEGTTYFAAGSGELNTELFRIDWAGKATATSFALSGGFTITHPGSGYAEFSNWVLLGTTGFYSSTNSAHLLPNGDSYGSWKITGVRNGWGGIEFGNNGVSLMMGSDTVGLHQNTNGWLFRVHNGSGFIYKGSWGGGTAATILDSSNAAYAWNMNQYVRTTDTCSFAALTVSNTITGAVSGNAGTATILQTARNINGTSFNGSAAITTANWGTARTLTIGSTGKSVDGSAAITWSLAEIGAAATNQTMFVGTTSVAINRTSSAQTLTGVNIDGNAGSADVATYARRVDGATRTSFTVGGNKDNYYPVIFNIGSGATALQYSEFVIERGGYEDPGYTFAGGNIFSTLNIRFSCKSSGWGYGATYENVEMHGYTTQMVANWQQMSEASKLIVWLRGATIYYFWNVVANTTLHDGNSGGTSLTLAQAPHYSYTYASTQTVQTKALYGKYVNSSTGTSGIYVAGNVLAEGLFSGPGTGLTGTASSLSIGGNAGTATILQTARNINGTSFNGSAAITTATWGTARTLTIGSTGKSVDGSAAITWSLAEIGAAATNQTMFVGTTSVAINRASAAQTLTGVSIDGSAASCTGNAATATTTDNINGRAFFNRNSGNSLAQDSYTNNGIGYVTGVSLFSQTDGGMYASAYDTSWIHQIYGDFRTGQIAIRGKNSGTWQSWRTVLDSTNASYAWNMNQNVRTTDTCSFAGLTVSNTINGSVTGNAGGSSTSCTGNAATATTATSAGSINSDTGNVGENRLQYWQVSGNTTLNPDTEWYNAIRMGHGNPVTYYGNTLAIRMTGGNLGDIYTRTLTNGTQGSWNRFWHNNNDGAGSGLDADLVDGKGLATAGTADTIVLRDASGHITGQYILGSYFNASAGNSENPTIGQIWTQNTTDNYLRKSTPAHFRSQVTDGSYPSLTGANASGTWSINITGNAGTATSATTATALSSMNISQFTNNSGYLTSVTNISGNAATATLATKASTLSQGGGNGTGMTFNWSGQGGQPTWLWGSNDGSNIYVWNPSNFNVNYATSAGSATSAGTATSAGSATTAGSCSGNAATATNVAASGITGQTGMWTSAARPGPYRLYRRDSDDDYSVQNYWTGVYWRLDGYYSNNTLHAGCSVSYADTAGTANALTTGNTYQVANLGIGVAASNRLHINGDGVNPTIRIDNTVFGTGSSSSRVFFGWLPISINVFGTVTTKYIQLYNSF